MTEIVVWEYTREPKSEVYSGRISLRAVTEQLIQTFEHTPLEKMVEALHELLTELHPKAVLVVRTQPSTQFREARVFEFPLAKEMVELIKTDVSAAKKYFEPRRIGNERR